MISQDVPDCTSININFRKSTTENKQINLTNIRRGRRTSFDAVGSDYLLDDCRWTLQRKKIGFSGKTRKTERNLNFYARKSKESYQFYSQHFKRYNKFISVLSY